MSLSFEMSRRTPESTMLSQSKGIGSVDNSASILGNVHTIPARPGLVAAVAFAAANRQAVRLVAEPLHARFCAIRRPNGLLHSISLELDLITDSASLKVTRAIQ